MPCPAGIVDNVCPGGGDPEKCSEYDKKTGKCNYSEGYWKTIDDQFVIAVQHAEQVYRTDYWINIIIVVIGIVLVAFSLCVSIVRGTDLSTLTYAGLGITDFVALFLVNPQKRLLSLLGDVGQIALTYKTWNQQNQVLLRIFAALDENPQNYATNDPAIQELIKEYAQIGEEALSAIERYIGKETSTTPK